MVNVTDGIRQPVKTFRLILTIAYVLIGATAAPAQSTSSSTVARQVDNAFITNNDTRSWPSHGLDFAETRFSKLSQLNVDNAKQLGLVWSYDLGSTRGVEATPLVVDGVMFVTAPWSVVHALDARTGKALWTYDPKVPRDKAYRACCDVVNRGVALYKGKAYVATVDGRLVALDASTGAKVWEQDTVPDHSRGYTLTGAPRVYNGKVIIGSAGGEYGVRGSVSAYDAQTGKMLWRWYTVPADPSKPFENKAMEKAAKTWDPTAKYWEVGGGGTVWNSMAFDPKLNLIYIGTDNGTPWSYHKRSPGGGDNLYLCSIVALNADTGEYVWHYQETPGDNWDFSATQDIVLADLAIDGKPRKVLLHAPKNGFFFVIDRVNGQFLSAKNFVDVNWASGYDATGRPQILPTVYERDKPYEIVPGPFGGHNWQSMSFNPVLGLAFIPAQNVPVTLADDKSWERFGSNSPGQVMSGVEWNLATHVNPASPAGKPFGRLIAWDPIQQKQVWSVEHTAPWNGGTLATAGNLVFQGTSDGRFLAYNAKTGEQLWQTLTGTGVIAAPSTYELDGKQYVSIAVGWGGVYGLSTRSTERNTPGTVYTFALGGTSKMPPFVQYQQSALLSGVKYKPEDVPKGTALYISNCAFCHGVPGVDKGGNIANLAYVDASIIDNLDKFLIDGPMTSRGMPNFKGKLTLDDIEKVKAFIQGTADAIRPKSSQQ